MMNLNTAVVLAGGKSSRLNFDKQTIRINGELMPVYIANCLALEFQEVIIVSNKPELYDPCCPYKIIPDTYVGLGPKAGILEGLAHATSDYVYFTGCDMPYVSIPYIQYMKELLRSCRESPSVVLAIKNGYFEPLNAFYAQSLKSCIQDQLSRNMNKISDLFTKEKTLCIEEKKLLALDPYDLMFINLNTPDDYKRLLSSGFKNHLFKQNL